LNKAGIITFRLYWNNFRARKGSRNWI